MIKNMGDQICPYMYKNCEIGPTNLYLFNFEFQIIYKYGGPSAANKLFCDFKNIVVFTHNKL